MEKGKATHSSLLAWRIPWTTVHEVTKSWTWLSNFHFTNLPSCKYSTLKVSLYLLQLTEYKRLLSCSFWQMLLRYLVQFSSVAQACPTLCNPMNHSTLDLHVHHQLPEFTQTHVHWVGEAIQPSRPLSSPSPPAPNPSQHQSLFQWVNSSHEVAKVLEFQV